MKTKTRSYRRLTLAAGWTLGLGLLATSGCLTRPLEPQDTRTTWTATFRQTSSGVDKIDLLLMLDNSGSMADKQDILSDAVPVLVRGLLNPQCVDKDNKPIPNQPASPADTCPAGTAREFQPVLDVHIGIVSSSLGSHGGNGCVVTQSDPTSWSYDDHGHLIARVDPTKPDQLPTYQNKGFLAWDPSGKADNPPGDSDLDGEVQKLRDMVKGVGDIGCGFESQLESWYRFLIDTEPYQTISLDMNNNVVRTGIDQALLDQRADFLRPDSMVAVLMLTDENDCSTREERYYPISNNRDNAMPRGRAICATDPNDHCCAPCGFAPKDCPADDTCQNPNLTPSEDPINLRCWNQKQRMGIDFLYPVQRYVDAITQAQIQRRDGQMVDNPLFTRDPKTQNFVGRSPDQGLVFVAGIVGVPWEDIARQDKDGSPDLINGLDQHGNQVGGFMSAAELSARDASTHKSRWDVILGDPANNVPPDDPLMRESRDPRMGTSPIVKSDLASASATSPTANPVNGHEWNTDAIKTSPTSSVPEGDLQYACIFPLKKTRDCSTGANDCDCAHADTNGSNNPLCQDDTGAYTQTQFKAKGYPGIRELEVLHGAGDQGIVASVCPASLDTSKMTDKDYGYNPAIGAIIDKLKQKLTGQCLNRPLKPDTQKQVKCIVIEASKSDGATCCTGKARSEVAPEYAEALDAAKADPFAAGDDCFCQIDQLLGAPLNACETDTSPVPVDANGNSVDGWCYVDSTVGNSELVSGCPSGEEQKVRFVGQGQPVGNAYAFITCSSDG